MSGTPRSAGWLRIPNAAAGVEALGIWTLDPASRVPYVFGLGVDDTGRISTSSRAGATITFPDNYSFGEALELRYSFLESGNSQRQGMYLRADTSIANSSNIRGAEIEARVTANVAVGLIQGLQTQAYTGSATSANITTLMGGSVEAQMGSAYTGTITNLYGLQVKLQVEDGATVTTGYAIYVNCESVTGAPTGAARLDAVIGVTATTATAGVFRYGIDTTGTEFTNGSANEVVLWAFKGANGTTYYMIHDTDAATVLRIDTTDPTT